MSASSSQGPDGTASNSESDTNVTASDSESATNVTADSTASASDGSATNTASASDGSASDTSAGSSDGGSTGGASTAGGTDPSAGEGGASDTDGIDGCQPTPCGDKLFECGDCLNNDGDMDGVDCDDPECFGPCDDSEAELGSPLEDKDPCKQDCYFDGNAGQGGGDCQWNLKCDPAQPELDDDMCPHNGWNFPLKDGQVDYAKCIDGDPATCKDHCSPPPGCDCFGCCEFPNEPDPDNIKGRFIGSPNCTLDDPKTCWPCTPMWDLCGNPCDANDANCFPDPDQNMCAKPQ